MNSIAWGHERVAFFCRFFLQFLRVARLTVAGCIDKLLKYIGFIKVSTVLAYDLCQRCAIRQAMIRLWFL